VPPFPTSHLSPGDAEAAVRSFPRRFRSVLARPDDHDDHEAPVDPDELARRVGPDGRSAVDHLLAADGVLSLVDRALEQARSDADPVLHPALADLGVATWDDPHSPLGSLLDQLEATARGCAERISSIATSEWGRQVRIADADRTRELLDLVRDAVDVTAGHLRAAERTIQAVR
jgi:hypothetical protein